MSRYSTYREARSPFWMGIYALNVIVWAPVLIYARTVGGRVGLTLWVLFSLVALISEASKPARRSS